MLLPGDICVIIVTPHLSPASAIYLLCEPLPRSLHPSKPVSSFVKWDDGIYLTVFFSSKSAKAYKAQCLPAQKMAVMKNTIIII